MIAKLTGTKFNFGESLATNAFMSAAKAAKLASIISKSKMVQEAIASLKKAMTTLGKKVASEIGVSAKKVLQSAKNTVNRLTKKASSGCNCCVLGTKIQTLTGEKNIEDIKLGDYVLSKNDHTSEVSYQPVTDTFTHETNEIYYVNVGNETIKTTFNHPFWVKGKGWTFAKDLRVGDELETAEDQSLPIVAIELKQETTMVYNMTVDEFHTYFVSDLGVWVHNTSKCGPCGVSFKGGVDAKNVAQFEKYKASLAADEIYNTERVGTAALKNDARHLSPSFLSKEQMAQGKVFGIRGGDGVQRTLLQVEGEMNGKTGIFKYILEPNGKVSHQSFIKGGIVTGYPNQIVSKGGWK